MKDSGRKLGLRLRKAARQFNDADYLHKLPQEARLWYRQVMDEMYSGVRGKEGRRVHPEEYAKRNFSDNNARNRDIWQAVLPDAKVPDEGVHTEDSTLERLDKLAALYRARDVIALEIERLEAYGD